MEHSHFIVYGTGRDASYIWDNIKIEREHIFAFCDKKANIESYTFHEKEVIKPEELKTKYLEMPILLSTRLYNKEIYSELCRMGIEEERFMVIL